MLLLVIALIMLPPALALTNADFTIINSPETFSKSDSMPARVNRGIVITREGGETPIKNLSVKVYEKEGDYQVIHISYAILYHSGDFAIAHRRVAAEEFDKLWLEIKRDKALYLTDAPVIPSDKPITYEIKIRELKQNNEFTVENPEQQDDERYQNIINSLEIFWQEQINIE